MVEIQRRGAASQSNQSKLSIALVLCAGLLLASAPRGAAQSAATEGADSGPAHPSGSQLASPQYVLRQGDMVLVRVYQEEDLTSQTRVARDGTINMPLLGAVKVASNSLERATMQIRDALAKDYLVNPQVTVSVVEFAKRRFTVLGQVQHPGTYDMPAEDAVSLLQAIATAGGYTRTASARKIMVQRTVGSENKLIRLDAEAMAANKKEKPFEIHPDDVIVVGEKWI